MEDEQKTELDKFFGEDSDRQGEQNAMIRHQETNSQAFKYLVDSNEKDTLMSYAMRTIYHNFEEMILFNDYVAWLEDFGLSYENARLYIASRPSVGGVGRGQLVKSLNPYSRLQEMMGGKKGYGGANDKDARKLPD